jgi:diketogulonate reductase-like aldo/keto reductase
MSRGALGATGLNLPPIGLGTWSVFDTDQDLSWLTREATSCGVRLFDTSAMYGRAEESLAGALGSQRADVLVATKVSANDAVTAKAQIARSLSLFGVIDLYQIHNIVGWRTHLPSLQRLKGEGSIRAIGASQGLLVSDEDFIEVMQTGHLDAIQIRYNPNRTGAASRIIPLAREMGIGVLVMQPLRWGVMIASPSPSELADLGVTNWGQAILRWILSNDAVSTVLTATNQPGRILANAAVTQLPAYTAIEKRLVERILARGARPTEAGGIVPADAVERSLETFLARRLGASFCDPCIAAQFCTSVRDATILRERLPVDRFVNETAACLVCGQTSRTIRSRTIMR